MVFRKSLNAITSQIKLVNFRHDGFKSAWICLFSVRLRRENFRWTA